MIERILLAKCTLEGAVAQLTHLARGASGHEGDFIHQLIDKVEELCSEELMFGLMDDELLEPGPMTEDKIQRDMNGGG